MSSLPRQLLLRVEQVAVSAGLREVALGVALGDIPFFGSAAVIVDPAPLLNLGLALVVLHQLIQLYFGGMQKQVENQCKIFKQLRLLPIHTTALIFEGLDEVSRLDLVNGYFSFWFVGSGLEDLDSELNVAGGRIYGKVEVKQCWLEDYASAYEFPLDAFGHLVYLLQA